MNRNQLSEMLKNQRARRHAAMAKLKLPARPRGKSALKTSIVLSIVIIASLGLFAIFITISPLASSQHARAVSTLQGGYQWLSPSPAASPMPQPLLVYKIVCTDVPDGRLNVRFAPGTTGTEKEIRGYLKEGELVTIVGATRDEQWSELSQPVEGWVSTHYLCKAEK